MHPVNFEGATEIRKPKNMTDEECYSLWAKFGFGALMNILKFEDSKDKLAGEAPDLILPGVVAGIDANKYSYYMTAWKPNKEDIEAINRGEPIYVKVLAKTLPPMALFTLDENNNGNF